MYHVGLDLTADQVKRLKQLALKADLTVRALVSQLVVKALVVKAIGSSQNKKIKEEEH